MEDTYKGSITLASVENGRDESEQIIVQSSDETIYKFYTSEGFKQYSPESVSFWVQQRGETYGEKVSGDVVSFETDVAAPLDSAKVTLTPQQSGSGTPSPTNVRPIMGTESVGVTRVGKNFLLTPSTWETGKSLNASTGAERSLSDAALTGFIPLRITEANSYYMSGLGFASIDRYYRTYVAAYNANKEFLGRTGGVYSAEYPLTVRSFSSGTPQGTGDIAYIRVTIYPLTGYTANFADIIAAIDNTAQIERGSTATEYEPYAGETTTTDLGRTVYGGTVDLVTGELTVTHGYVDLGTLTWQTKYTGSTNKTLSALPPYLYNKRTGLEAICDKYPIVDQVGSVVALNEPDSKTVGIYGYIHQSAQADPPFYMVLPIGDTPSGNICYKLATPQTYQLTPAQVNALLGANTVWSDAGQIDIIYPKKDGTIVRPTSNLIPDVDYDHELELVGTSVEDYKNLWSFFGRVYGTLNADEITQSTQVLNLVRTISNNQVIFSIDNLNNLAVDEERTSSADVILFNSLQSQLSGSNYFFNFKVYKPTNNEPPLAIDLIDYKPIGVEFGTSDDMAQFSLTATSIQQLVRDAKLTFDAQGLHLENGAFDITDTGYHLAFPTSDEFNNNKTSYYTYDTGTGEYIPCTSSSIYSENVQYYTRGSLELLAYDPNLQTLRVNGSGKFTGTIEATDGYFSGELRGASGEFSGTVQANAGVIGGWTIRENGLYSEATSDNKSLIELLGAKGIINAQTINLGTGAHINDLIQLGANAVLYNPDEHTGKVLSLGNSESISLYDTGLFQLGNITLDGENSIIKGKNWSIDPNFARFRNVEVSGKISSAVFETASVSAVGGIMLFKTSYKVESFSDRNIVLDTKYSGNVGDSVYLTNSDGQLSELMTIDATNEKQITLAEAIPFTDIISLIQIGNINSRPIIIGVNSTDTNAGFLNYQGITISEVYKEGNNIKNDIKAFLGNLQSLNIQGVTGYGLYGSNVYLTGSLTSQVQGLTTSYAGINTLNGANATKFDNDTSKIVFWAGSEGITNEQIAAAPFQVTENGSIYASRGIFEGSIISRSTIEGSVIRTARIEGSGTNPALKILDAINGIGFYTAGANNQDVEAFTIGSDGFKIDNNHFISISNNSIDFNGRNITIDSLYTRNVDGITLTISQNKIESKYGNVTTPSITFKTNGIDLTIQSTDSKFSVTESLTSLNTDLVEMKKNIAYGNIMKYERIESGNGYDLYVY